MMESPRFFNPFADIEKSGNKLPHWQQPGATYFITFRLGDSVPESLRPRWQTEREAFLLEHPKPWTIDIEIEYHQRFSKRMDEWLDAGHGSCVLRRSDTRDIVAECLRFFDEQRYVHHAWVIMPNHAHTLTTLSEAWRLDQIIGTWKSFTSNRINEWLSRCGTLWQEDYFDRLIRDAEHFTNVVRYIRRNPEKAKLRSDEFTHFESDLARKWAP